MVLRSRRPFTIEPPPSRSNGSTSPDGAGHTAQATPLPRPPRGIRLLTRTTFRNESLALRTALLTRPIRGAADVARIAAYEADGKALTIYPPPTVPPVSRLTTDPKLLAAALESGREAANALFSQEMDRITRSPR